MFQTYGQLGYVVTVPFVSNEPYLRYLLKTWPIPIENEQTDSLYKLDITPFVAQSTENGVMTDATACHGDDPIVCLPAPVYSNDGLQCERGLINQHINDRSKCNVKRQDKPKKSKMVRDNTKWILTAISEEISLSCRGRPEQRRSLTTAIYRISLPSSCTLTGHDWTLQGEEVGNPNVTITDNDTIKLDMQWLQDIIDEVETQTNNELVLPNFPEWIDYNKSKSKMNDLLDKINNLDDNDNVFNDPIHAVQNYTQTAVIVVIMLIIFIVSIIVYKKRELIKYYFKTIKPKKQDVNPEEVTQSEPPNIAPPTTTNTDLTI